MYTNPEPQLHVTVFHTSQPTDTRPAPLELATFEESSAPQARPGPSPDSLAKEKEVLVSVVEATPSFHLEVQAYHMITAVLLRCPSAPETVFAQQCPHLCSETEQHACMMPHLSDMGWSEVWCPSAFHFSSLPLFFKRSWVVASWGA